MTRTQKFTAENHRVLTTITVVPSDRYTKGDGVEGSTPMNRDSGVGT